MGGSLIHRRRKVGAGGARAPPILSEGGQSTSNILLYDLSSQNSSTVKLLPGTGNSLPSC